MLYRNIYDRSNLDEVISYNPAKGNITRRESLQDAVMPRADVVLFGNTRSGSQYALYVTYGGFAGDIWLLDMLTEEEHDQVQRIAARMRANAVEYNPAWKLLGQP